MRMREKTGGIGMRCGRCGCGVEFDGIVELGDESQPGFLALAAFKCRVCGHGFMDLMDRSRALAMESRLQAAAPVILP